MDDLLATMPLCGLQAKRAYALVGLAHPAVSAKQWTTFVSRYAHSPRQRRGLIGIQDGRGYVHGVFCYAVDRPFLDGNRILGLHDLILAHLPGRTLVEALTTCVKQLATEFGCLGISVDLPATTLDGAQHGSTQAVLQSAGFRISAVKMRRDHTVACAL